MFLVVQTSPETRAGKFSDHNSGKSSIISRIELSMAINFHKYQGAGNDFIMIDDRIQTFTLEKEDIASLCDRRFGIGADGLILIREDADYDFRMVYFNADGGEGSMCGNGGRCAVRFAHDLGIIESETRFIAIDGEHEASVTTELIRLGMTDVSEITEGSDYHFLNTGSPHYVRFVQQIETVDVVGIGRSIRYGDIFGPQGGTNVNFSEVTGDNQLKVRTYERGVEDETLACGTGVTACALVAAATLGWNGPVDVQVPGGALKIEFTKGDVQGHFQNIYLIGPAELVFKGSV